MEYERCNKIQLTSGRFQDTDHPDLRNLADEAGRNRDEAENVSEDQSESLLKVVVHCLV